MNNKYVRPTPEGQRERIKENIREIAAWLDDRCEEDIGFYDAADVLSRNFVRTHSDDFDIKREGQFVYTGDGATEGHVVLDCGEFVPLSEDKSDQGDS